MVSSGLCEIITDIPGLGVEADEAFVGQGDADDHFGFACGGEFGVEGDEVRIVSADDSGDGEQDGVDAFPPAPDGVFSGSFAAVVGDGGEACELADGCTGQCADLGQFGHQAGHDTVCHTFDGAQRPVEFLPQRIAADQQGDGRRADAAAGGIGPILLAFVMSLCYNAARPAAECATARSN